MTEREHRAREAARTAEERDRDILRARAIALSRPLEALADRSNDFEYALFSVEGDRFAIDATFVREVLPVPEVTALPGKARVFVGITSLRGEILPVATLSRLFSGAGATPANATYLVVLGQGRPEVGVLASTVEEVRSLELEALSPGGHERGLTRGVTKDGLVVLDAAALLSDPRLSVSDDAEG